MRLSMMMVVALGALTACGSVDFVASPVGTVVTEAQGVGFDEFGRGVVGAGEQGLCIFSGPEGMVGEIEVPGSARVLDMFGSRAMVIGDSGHIAFPDQHRLDGLTLAAAGTPAFGVLTHQGAVAALQQDDACLIVDQAETLARIDGTCQDLASDRFGNQVFALVDNVAFEVAGGHARSLDLGGEHLAFDATTGDLWTAEGDTLTRLTLLSGDIEVVHMSSPILDVEAAGQAWGGVLVAQFRARDSIVHVRSDGTKGTTITPPTPATGVTVNFEGTFVAVEGQQQVDLYGLAETGSKRRQIRDALAGGASGGTMWVEYD